MLLPSPGTASRSRNVDGAPGSAQSGLSAAERPWGHPLSSPLQAFPEMFCSSGYSVIVQALINGLLTVVVVFFQP